MEKFNTFKGIAAPFNILNVDTDKIIPKQFLTTIKRTGLGKHVFDEMRYKKDGSENPNFVLNQKILFGLGASIASFLFFFIIGYLSKYLSNYAQSDKVWKIINIFIISFMSLLTIFVILETVN